MTHFKDDLSRDEIAFSVQRIREEYSSSQHLRFTSCYLYVQPKGVQKRASRTTCWHRLKNNAIVFIIDLPSGRLEEIREYEDSQPAMSEAEYALCEEILRKDARFIEAIQRRGFRPDQISADAWCVGYFSEEDDPSRRLAWPALFIMEHKTDNMYARPLEGLSVRVDIQQEKIVHLEDMGMELFQIAPNDPLNNYLPPVSDCLRPDPKPITVEQPEGPSFSVQGQHIAWEGWSFRYAFRPREGLVLLDLTIQDPMSHVTRRVADSISFSEMVVPYGDPNYPHFLKNAFDAGEDGLGKNSNSLRLGCDCLGAIRYFDAHMVDYMGDVVTIEHAVCLHEEDDGLFWKHTDWRSNSTVSARCRKLVISFIATIANYDYGFYYYLFQDGRIEMEVKLTGILSTGFLKRNELMRPFGTKLSPEGLYAPVHQHFFIARLDMAVDGQYNNVFEYNGETLARHPEENPEGNAFFFAKTQLRSESEARRDLDIQTGRFWTIESTTRRNRGEEMTAYEINPHNIVALPFSSGDATWRKRAGFLNHHLWVTKTDNEELHPSGLFPNQDASFDGIHKQVLERNLSIEDEDVTLWVVFGVNHLPRLEDWPVMPREVTGITIRPRGFFDISPVLGLQETQKEMVEESKSQDLGVCKTNPRASKCECRRNQSYTSRL